MRLVNQTMTTVSVDDVRPHPQNPNRGDVGAVFDSIEANGFFGAIGVQASTGHILWGNHRYEAALQAGARELPAFMLDVTDEEALRILLVDNRSARLAKDDDNILADVLQLLASTDAGLAGTGFTNHDLDELIESLGQAITFDDQEPDGEVLRYDQVEFVVRVPKANVTEAMEALVKRIAEENGGRLLIKGNK